MIKKQLTKEEIDGKAAEKKAKIDSKKAITKAKNIMKDICEKRGLRVAEIQLQYAKDNPDKLFTSNLLSENQIIEALNLGINEYKESLILNK